MAKTYILDEYKLDINVFYGKWYPTPAKSKQHFCVKKLPVSSPSSQRVYQTSKTLVIER